MVRCGWAGCPRGQPSPGDLGRSRSRAEAGGPEPVRAQRSGLSAQSVRARRGWCSHLSSGGQPASGGCNRWKALKPTHASPSSRSSKVSTPDSLVALPSGTHPFKLRKTRRSI
ncbi:hypothetical protein PCANC_22296 [Puccinia coronata f. sp. avenae]|uniref:Uncharacterized protein n=1 Tax=Puccinia coronata f. sp. avenae TaxID=200324 RepID=A0A2N5S973_9BASI|nr:hypothetical protein PCANC_22296 [Puccinia coronata f. sp. avenae]